MKPVILFGARVHDVLDELGTWLPQILLRGLLAYEFFESGLEKLRGDNWFDNIRDQFPFPLNVLPPDLSWTMATWAELLLPVLLLTGLGTRFAAFSLLVLTGVAWYAVHAGHGYNVCDNGFKLPLMYCVLLVPLILSGAGRFSVDRWLYWKWRNAGERAAGRVAETQA